MYINHEIYAADIASIANENLSWESLRITNIKITTVKDIELFKALLAAKKTDWLK